jgi:spore germination protein KC
MGIGVDSAEDGQYKIIGQFANAVDFGEENSERSFTNMSQIGDGIQIPLRDLGNMLSRKLYTGHTQVITIGRKVAENGLNDVLDYFCRSSNARYSIPLFVAEKTADELFELEPKVESMPVTVLINLLSAQKYDTMCGQSTLADFMNETLSPTTAPTLPLVGIDAENNHAILRGSAVFKGERMIGTLTPHQSRSRLVIIGAYKGGTHEVKTPDGSTVDLRIILSKTRIIPKYENGEFSIEINAKFRCILSAVSIDEKYYKPEKRKQLEKYADASFARELQNAIDVSRGLNSDVFGFGEAIYKKYPKESKELLADWDSVYPNLNIIINVETILDSSGAISENISKPAKDIPVEKAE